MSKSSIVVLTGAGISAESGISTFRDSNGLWENHSIDEVATPEGFAANPDLVYEFYNQRRRQLLSDTIAPNPAHLALAKLEQEWPGDFLLVTQNVDNLHERANSKNILHMHGELLKARDKDTGEVIEWHKDMSSQSTPHLRPHIVWFGEVPLHMDEIYTALEKCSIFISVGTSGNVYPAAGFVQVASHAHTIEINAEPTAYGSLFKDKRVGKAGELLPKLVEELLH